MALYNETQRKKVVATACEIVRARVGGASECTAGSGKTKQVCDLQAGGWCNRFVRQVFECGLAIKAFGWYFGALRACDTIKKLKPYKVPLKDRRPGDILGCPGNPGHIALYVGNAFDPEKELVAENTSSARRGFPKAAGTKVSSFEDFVAQHDATWCYRLFAEP